MKAQWCGVVTCLCAWQLAGAEDVVRLPAVVVTGQTEQATMAWAARDSAEWLRDVPGAATVRNGPLTGIAQLRGLAGDRVRVLVDGMVITPACPNHMDPPLHYAAPTAVEPLAVTAGITPVRLGGDSIAGTIVAEPAAPRFAAGERPEWSGNAGTAFRTVNDGRLAHGAAGIAGPWWSGRYQASYQDGEDYRFDGGEVAATEFRTAQQGLTLAAKSAVGVWAVDFGQTRTRDAGTPALPMDLIRDDGYRAGLKFTGEALSGRVYGHWIDHLMDNYTLRPAPMMRMSSAATSGDWGGRLDATRSVGRQTWRAGAEFHGNQLDASQRNRVNDLRQDTFQDATRDRLGGYGEWEVAWTEQWQTLVGARLDGVWADAGKVRRFFPATATDAAAFNASDRSRSDVNVEATATTSYRVTEWCTVELGAARKCRAPSTLERYLWTPLSASAGQADGRTYFGNLKLDSEVSHQVAGAVRLQGARWQVEARPFYNWVSDYIQGEPIARLDAAGLPVLQYRNVDRVDLYGAEGAGRYAVTDWLAVAATLSYVRGINRDRDEDLYRIAPLHGTVRLEHRWKQWASAVEAVWAARQSSVAEYNNEPTTAGWAVMNWRASYDVGKHLTAELAVENIFDKRYADHLGGINRVAGSDVPVGRRLPAPGRAVVVGLSCRF